jgi:DHA1 family tetracycline resistance protein-like MFS transporter
VSYLGPAAPRRALAFVLVTVALDATGIGLLIPVIPRLVADLSGEGLAAAAIYGGWLTAVFAGVQFFAGPILGSLSDYYGRRPVLLLSLTAFGASYILMGFASSLLWLFAAQMLAGLFGATPSTAGAYIADISAPADRAKHFGWMGAAFGTGLIIGPVLGGALASFGSHTVFFASALLSFANVVYGYFALPESLAIHNRRPFRWKRAHPVGALLRLRQNAGIMPLLLALLVMQIVMQTVPTTWPYFTMLKFGWTPRDVGMSLGIYGLSNILIQSLLTGRISSRFGNSFTARAGFIMLMLGYLGFAFAPIGSLLLACIPVTVIGFATGPAITSLLSGRVDAASQGVLQGVMASGASLAAILTPPIMSKIFSTYSVAGTAHYFPGAPYVAAAGLAMVGALMTLWEPKPVRSLTSRPLSE